MTNRIRIGKNTVLGGAKKAAIWVEDPDTEIEAEGTTFVNNAQDVVAPDGMRKLSMTGCHFPSDPEQVPQLKRALKGYVQGFSFGKGDHLEDGTK